MNLLHRNNHDSNNASSSHMNNNNESNDKDTNNSTENEKPKPTKAQIAEFTNIRDLPLHRVQFVEYRGGDSIFLLRVSITFAIITIITYIVLSYVIDVNVKDYESKWKKIYTNIFISYSSGISFIFITWGVAFYFVSQVISQRIDAELLHNEYNIDGNKILFIRGSIPDFYHFKKELTKGCNIKLVKVPFLFNNKISKTLHSEKIDDFIPYSTYNYPQFQTNNYYSYNAEPSNNNSSDSLDSLDSINNKPKSINTIQRAINNSSKLEKILIATPINLSS
ncbi:hypothetical protein BCR36DRAFT_408787 [Piromyces finnis]|uniref:Uncharacterized protein n=1 Tax=Piromyces finnis TaxID=1754191 RepID=A0A1Y1VLJ1_9FUNG|nr:hypothetical protein BCR36DRAFT_408787 [Piromyces finnis]|eukprot:ORX59292.1 hypothetical protein BCR36DRAFT_408787 [Piromyces finnis]